MGTKHKTLDELNKTERSLLLYFETCAVDFAGRVNGLRMNKDDFAIANRWNAEGFIQFGRIVLQDHNRDGGNWCKLSPMAFRLAHAERRARAERMWDKRVYHTTSEASSTVPIVAEDAGHDRAE